MRRAPIQRSDKCRDHDPRKVVAAFDDERQRRMSGFVRGRVVDGSDVACESEHQRRRHGGQFKECAVRLWLAVLTGWRLCADRCQPRRRVLPRWEEWKDEPASIDTGADAGEQQKRTHELAM